jgi:ABC-type transport system involved in cytochrome bd biosynthesis fused ATPase/permease subunit
LNLGWRHSATPGGDAKKQVGMTALHPFPLLPPGLVAVTGGERTGKTSFLRRLSGDLPALTDDETPQQVWDALQARSRNWNVGLHQDLIEALGLSPHLNKKLFMLSAGSRRKVALAGLLASGAKVTCLDQPFAALDAASIRVIREFLQDMASHPTRTWVVADYEADPGLPWRRVISLD